MQYNLFGNALSYTKCSPSHSRIRPLPLPGQLFCSVDQIALHLLPIQIRIISPHNPPFHQKCCRSADKGGCKGGSRDRLITTARTWCTDIDARSGKVRFDLNREAGVTAAGEIGVGLAAGIVGCYGDGRQRGGWNRKCGFRGRAVEAGGFPYCFSTGKPHGEFSLQDTARNQTYTPDAAVNITFCGKKIDVDFLRSAVRRRFSIINQKLCSGMPVSLCSQRLFQRTDNRSVRMYQGNLHLVLIVFPDLQVHSRFISSDPQFCLIIFSLSYAARSMPCLISFITGSHTECHTTIPNRLIQIRFHQRGSVMCSL